MGMVKEIPTSTHLRGGAPKTSPWEEEMVPSSSKDFRAARGCSHFGFLNSS